MNKNITIEKMSFFVIGLAIAGTVDYILFTKGFHSSLFYPYIDIIFIAPLLLLVFVFLFFFAKRTKLNRLIWINNGVLAVIISTVAFCTLVAIWWIISMMNSNGPFGGWIG